MGDLLSEALEGVLEQRGVKMITTADKARETMTLGNVTKGGQRLPARWMLYGVDGIGKSTFASQSPDPIFICTEDGALNIDVPQFPLCESWDDVMACLRELYSQEHHYKTAILDSADWAQALAVRHVTKNEFGDDTQSYEAYGRGAKSLMREWQKFLQALDYLRKKRGMEIGMIAHAIVKAFKNPTGDDYDRYQSNLSDSASTSIWGKTKEWCDIVMFANYDVLVKKDNIKATKGKGLMKQGDNGRVMYTQASAAWDAKVREGWNLPAKMPLSQEVFRSHLTKQAAITEQESE